MGSIVPVFKGDPNTRICGDCKQTINKAIDCDKYPISKTEDIFVTLNGGGGGEIGEFLK